MFSIPAVKDLVSWMQVIGKGNLKDIALYRIIKNKYGSRPAHEIFSHYSLKNFKSLLDVIRNDKNVSKNFSFLNDVLKKIDYFERIIHKRTAGEIVWDICEELNILKPRSRYLMNDRYAILNIGNLLLRAQKFSENIKSNKIISILSICTWAVINPRISIYFSTIFKK